MKSNSEFTGLSFYGAVIVVQGKQSEWGLTAVRGCYCLV